MPALAWGKAISQLLVRVESSLVVAPNHLRQHRRLTDVGGLAGCDQGEVAAAGQGAKVSESIRPLLFLQFGTIAGGELVEALRNVAVPGAQFRRRCHVFEPLIEVG